jgi:N-acetylmuramidase
LHLFGEQLMTKHHVPPLIAASVGRGAVHGNRPQDVQVIEYLLNIVARMSVFPEDGKCSDQLISAILKFQMQQLKFPIPDGRVDPSGCTLAGLVERAYYARLGQSNALDSNAPAYQKTVCDYFRTFSAQHADKAASRRATLAPGAKSKLTDADFRAAADALGPGVQVAMIRAFAEVESGGKSGFGPASLPVIAYEGHWFRKLTNKIYDTTHPLLSYPYKVKAGPEWQKNNKDQETAWNTLKQAMELDHDAALKSCSWGMFQVMGFNYQSCGYSNVDDFVTAMKAGERGQLDAFVGYCKKTSGLRSALKDKNFAMCAQLYNGDDYGDYDKRISKAFKKYGGT